MTVSKELEAEIARLGEADHWKPGTIGNQLQVHHDVVDRILAEREGVDRAPRARPSMTDEYVPFLQEKLRRYPKLPATVLFRMAKERGYKGICPVHFRRVVRRYRPRPVAEAYLNLRTLPGDEAQADWAFFGKIVVDGVERDLALFVMVLSWSRRLSGRFYLNARLANFLRGHEHAFLRFEGVSRKCKIDNLKSAVLERVGTAIRYQPKYLAFARHYRFEPRPVGVARGNEKGRVERVIRFIRESFFMGRAFTDVADLNRQFDDWCRDVADARPCPEDPSMTVAEAYAKEREHLLPLPANPFPTDECVAVSVGKKPYVRFDTNDYSVPHTCVRRTLEVVASLDTVRVVDGTEVVATHPRSYGKRRRIEDPKHIEKLLAYKKRARPERAIDRLHHALPHSQELFTLLAERGENLGAATTSLSRLLAEYGAQAVEEAIVEALAKGAPHPNSVRCVLERKRHEKGDPVPIPVTLPDDPRVRNLTVTPHALSTYDALKEVHDDVLETPVAATDGRNG